MNKNIQTIFTVIAAILGLFIITVIYSKCSTDKQLSDLTNQISRYQDTVLTFRKTEDGKVITDSKGSELSLAEYRALDAERSASFERMMRNSNAQMLATVSLLISRPAVTGNAPVTINADKTMVIDLTDSCSLVGDVRVDSMGKATKNIRFRSDSLDLAIYRDREKWWQGKQVTASSVIRNNCGTITGQKAVVVAPGKKKVHQTGLFKAGMVIAIGEALRFLITGKL